MRGEAAHKNSYLYHLLIITIYLVSLPNNCGLPSSPKNPVPSNDNGRYIMLLSNIYIDYLVYSLIAI